MHGSVCRRSHWRDRLASTPQAAVGSRDCASRVDVGIHSDARQRRVRARWVVGPRERSSRWISAAVRCDGGCYGDGSRCARPEVNYRIHILVPIVAWIVPGAGHLLQRRWQKGLVFLVILPLMFGVGLILKGRIFPFELTQPLVALAAFATLGNGLPYLVANVLDAGEGLVTAASYEYGNTFLIVSGLLNMLVILDAYDIAVGRKG